VLKGLFKRAGAVAIGTGLGQGLVLVVTPLLARRHGPAEFGTLALLMTVSNVSMSVACVRFDMALPSAKEESVRGLLRAAIVSATVLGLLGVCGVLCAGRDRLTARYAGDLLDHPLLVGSCIALVGFYQATGAWLLRRGQYTGLAVMRLSQGGGFSALAAVPGIGLLWGHVLSFAGGLYGVWYAGARRRDPELPWSEAGRRHLNFPLYNLPGAVVDVVGYSLCIWVVAGFYGQSAAGEYSQLQRIIGAPLMLMSISLGQILLRNTAELMHDLARMRELLARLLRVMALVAAVALVVLWAAGGPLVAWMLGPKWHVDRELVVLIGVSVFVRACVSPLSSALLTLRKFGAVLSWQAAYFCSAMLLMPFVAGRVGFHGYIRFYALHESVFYGAYLGLIFLAVRNETCVESLAS
jgi:O-antigen/teichoic acid export membrane protein